MASPRLPVVSERVEQQHIVQLLRSIGSAVYVLGTTRRRGDHPGTMQTAGLPDLIAFLPSGRLLFVEVKRKGGRLRPEQQEFRALALAADVAHVVGSLDSVIVWLVGNGFVRADQFPHYRVDVDYLGVSRT